MPYKDKETEREYYRKNFTTVAIKLPVEAYSALKERLEEDGRSVSRFVKDAIRDFTGVEVVRHPRPRKKPESKKDSRAKTFHLASPSGEVYEGECLVKFIRENNLFEEYDVPPSVAANRLRSTRARGGTWHGWKLE